MVTGPTGSGKSTTLASLNKEGIRIYGKKDFYEGIKLQIIYDNVYDIVVEEMLQNNEEQLKEDYYNQKKTEKDFPTGMSKEEFLEKYYIDFEEYVFDNWLEAKRKSADIKIYKNMEDKQGMSRKYRVEYILSYSAVPQRLH